MSNEVTPKPPDSSSLSAPSSASPLPSTRFSEVWGPKFAVAAAVFIGAMMWTGKVRPEDIKWGFLAIVMCLAPTGVTTRIIDKLPFGKP